MKQPFGKTKKGITFKLLLINGMLYIGVGVIIVGIFYSYRHVKTALTEVFASHTQAMAQNAYIGKELTLVLADASYLVSAFYRNDNLLNNMGTQLNRRLKDLQKRVENERLIKLLKSFNLTIQMVLEQCGRINQIHRKVTSLRSDFNATINILDEEISAKSLDMMLKGEDATPFQQLTIIIPELHESFLEINLRLFDMGLKHFETNIGEQQHPLLSMSDNLSLRLLSMTSPIDSIAGHYEQLKKTVQLYRETVAQLHPAARTFKMRRAALEQMKETLLAQLEVIDTRMADTMAATAQTMMFKIEKGARIGSAVALAVLFSISILVFLVGRTITRSINKIVIRVKDIAEGEGDLTVSLADNARDETGALAHQLNRFIANLREMIREISGNAVTLNRFAGDLSSVSGRMSEEVETVSSKSGQVATTAEDMSVKINTMAVASDEINDNITAISSATEQMSQNMNSAASSIEEMNTVVSAISENAQEGAGMTACAQETAQIASDAMNELNDAVNEIGDIIDVIGQIASRTNLLAINARIEAASAGNAGKGFAVVANEIKALAVRSAKAASEVTDHIESIQKRTGNAIKVFADLSAIILTVNQRISDISSAVRQQSQSTGEISANMFQADAGVSNISSSITGIAFKVNEMSADAGDAADAAIDVAKNILAVSEVSDSSNSNARKVSTSADELAQVAAQLQKLVDRFKVDKGSIR